MTRICPDCDQSELGYRRKYCDSCLEVRNEQARIRRMNYMRERRRKEKSEVSCAECGKGFLPTINNKSLCSDKCRDVREARRKQKYNKRRRLIRAGMITEHEWVLIQGDWPVLPATFDGTNVEETAKAGYWPEDALFRHGEKLFKVKWDNGRQKLVGA